MSEGGHHHGGDVGGHHHGGDMGGQQGFQPGMFPPHEPHHHHIAEPFDPMPSAYGRRRPGALRYRPRAGSLAWVVLWVVRLAILAFIVYVAFQFFHDATSTPSL
jgi:hypothetical protein